MELAAKGEQLLLSDRHAVHGSPGKTGQGVFWYAYRRSQGKLYKMYLGPFHQLTDERLAEAARQLADKIAHSSR